MSSLTILGLGPGDKRFLTLEAWTLLAEVAGTTQVYLRTADHPVSAELPCDFTTFDHLYTANAQFEAVYEQIVNTVLEAATSGDVIYAVPGDPHVGEFTTFALLSAAAERGIATRTVRGLSFFEPMVASVGIDGMEGIQVFDAVEIAQHYHAPVTADRPLFLGQVYSQMLANDLKLALLAVYPPEHQVALVHAAGGDNEVVEWGALHQFDHSEHIRNLTTLYVPPLPTGSSLEQFADTIAILRSPEGCPWDREQTPQSLREGLLEEAAEVVAALDVDDIDNLREELGDLLFHIVIQTQMATEAGDFTLTDVIADINRKIIRRHPHVWGEGSVDGVDGQVKLWAEIKAQEKAERALRSGRPNEEPESILDNIPAALSPLSRAQKIQNKVGKVGFEWPDINGVFDKLAEEIAELRSAEDVDSQAEELGDILFVLANVARWLKLDAATVLREANLKFIRRFQGVESHMRQDGVVWDDQPSLASLEAYWQQVKAAEKR